MTDNVDKELRDQQPFDIYAYPKYQIGKSITVNDKPGFITGVALEFDDKDIPFWRYTLHFLKEEENEKQLYIASITEKELDETNGK